MSGYVVDPVIWESELAELSDGQRCVWLYLLCGGGRRRLPGLVPMGTLALADALRRPEAEVHEHVRKFVELEWLQYDERYRMLRLPEAPKNRYCRCGNPNILVRWWTEWLELPPSPLKYQHLPALTHAVHFEQCSRSTGRYSMLEGWQESFGPELERWNQERRDLGMAEDYGRIDELKIRDANSNGTGRLDDLIRQAGEGVGGEDPKRGRGRGRGRGREGFGNPFGNGLSAGNHSNEDHSDQKSGTAGFVVERFENEGKHV